MKRVTRLVVPLIAGLALAGCVSAPERRAPDLGAEVPREWSADEERVQGAPEGRWWESFGDPQLVELVDLALERNHDLRAAVARLDRAAAQAKFAGADLKPQVGIGVTATRQRQNFIGFPIDTGGEIPSVTFESYGLSLDVGWEADLWGRIRAGARAAVADFQASAADLRAARQSLAAQTVKLWLRILEARQQVALAEASVRSFKISADYIRDRYDLGLRSALDLRLALSNLGSAEALLTQREIQLDVAVRQLEVLLGRYPDGTLLQAFDAEKLPEPPGPVPAGLPSELIARRPDLVAAERRLAAADQRYRAARRALYPRLTLTASGGTTTAALGDLIDGDFRVWSLLGGLTQPLFQGGRLRANVEGADATTREAFEFFITRVLGAFAEVESTLVSERLLAEQEEQLEEVATQLVAARRLAEERYVRGVAIYLFVLESQTRALTAESELLSLRRRRLDNRVDLHLALGGGFEELDAPDGATERGTSS